MYKLLLMPLLLLLLVLLLFFYLVLCCLNFDVSLFDALLLLWGFSLLLLAQL